MQKFVLEGVVPRVALGITVFDPLLCDFDAVILLRRESIPNADFALMQPEGQRSRLLPRLLAASGFPGDKEDMIVPPKNARALLRTIPHGEHHTSLLLARLHQVASHHNHSYDGGLRQWLLQRS